MNLRQVFNSLEHLHLSGLAIVNDGAGIAEIDLPVIITALNETLTDLYTRFDLKTSEVLVRLIKGQYEYVIHSDFADNNLESTEPVRWVIDSVDNKFKDDISHILSVTASTEEELPLNKSNYCNAVYTPTYNTLQVPEEVVNTATALSVIYKANHPLIPVNTTLDVDTVTLEIPQTMFNVLVLGICNSVYRVKGGKDGYAKSLEYFQRYEAEVNKLQVSGLFTPESEQGKHFAEGGWV